MSDQWSWWRSALAGDMGTIYECELHSGFYRARLDKKGPLVPVAIWQEEGSFLCRVGYDDLYVMRNALDVWTWCADKPISHELYQIAARTHSWPDQDGDHADEWAEIVTGRLAKRPDRPTLEALEEAVDRARKAAKAPALEAGRQIDAKYKPIIERIRDAKIALRKAELETA